MTAGAAHPSVFIKEAMQARGWDADELARRMGGDFAVKRLCLDLYFLAGPTDPHLLLGDGEDFSRAFGISAEVFRNLEKAWLARECGCICRAQGEGSHFLMADPIVFWIHPQCPLHGKSRGESFELCSVGSLARDLF